MEFDLEVQAIFDEAQEIFERLEGMGEESRIQAINAIKMVLHEYSPMAAEPVDCVLWVPSERVGANDYNPNKVAPPEMRLLERSIAKDGYTQPIVTFEADGLYEVVDGFHRSRVGKESKKVKCRIKGYLPVTVIKADRTDRSNRIAATIRHNRARGRHQIEAMSEVVIELSRRNWSAKRIGKELGMEPDEVLRLKQITGLAEMFKDEEFSKAWESDEAV